MKVIEKLLPELGSCSKCKCVASCRLIHYGTGQVGRAERERVSERRGELAETATESGNVNVRQLSML